MANSNLPGYMEIKVDTYDGDADTGELNLSYDEIEKYFLLADGDIYARMPSEFPGYGGMRLPLANVENNTVTLYYGSTTIDIYMSGGSSRAFSLTEPTP